MSYIIAFAGKGGVGKSTFAALTIRYLIEKGKKQILAVDADPNYCLPELLGVSLENTLASIREQALIEKPEGVSLDEWLEIQVNKSIVESKDFDLIVMGRPEGDGCYCAINNTLKRIIKEIANNYKYIVVDNEAGMEHISRGILNRFDLLFIISTAARSSLQSALRIRDLLVALKIFPKRQFLIVNQLNRELDNSEKRDFIEAFENIYYVNFDIDVLNLSERGESIFALSKNSSIVKNFYRVLEDIFERARF